MGESYNSTFTGAQIDEAIQKVRDGVVQLSAQTLTDEQKTQARTNIGAVSQEDFESEIEAAAYGRGASQAGALKWDGLIGDKAYISMGENMYLVHVSDEVPTVLAELSFATGSFSVLAEGVLAYGVPLPIAALSEDGLYMCGSDVGALIVPSDNYTMEGITFPKKGVYFLALNSIAYGFDVSHQYLSCLKMPGYSFAESGGGEYFETVTEVTEVGDTLTWDGEVGNRQHATATYNELYYRYVLVSPSVISQAELLNGGIVTISTTEGIVSATLGKDMEMSEVTDDAGNIVALQCIYCLIALTDNALLPLASKIESDGTETVLASIIFPRAGIYFADIYTNGIKAATTQSLAVPDYSFIRTSESTIIKTEHLPKALRFGEITTTEYGDTLTWDGNTTGLVPVADTYYKISDAVPNESDFANGGTAIFSNGSVVDFTADDIAVDEDSGAIVMTLRDEVVGLFVVFVYRIQDFPDTGTYGVISSNGVYVTSLTINGYTGFPTTTTELVKVDEKYLPDTVVQNGDTELILASPGGKKFSITVSDDGTLTATEVTA